jgi:hypothetical protein
MLTQSIQKTRRGKQSLKIVNTYQPTRHDIDDGHFRTIRNNTNIINLGDLNARMTHPLQNTPNENGIQLDDLTDKGIIRTHAPDTYTRYDDHYRTPSILDFAITSLRFPHDIKITVEPNIGSDHRPVFFTIDTTVHRKDHTHDPRPDFNRADWTAYKQTKLTVKYNTSNHRRLTATALT